MAIKVIICLVLGYIFGCFQTGYFYGKLFKELMSAITCGKCREQPIPLPGQAGRLYCLSWDALKAVFAVWIVRYLLFQDLVM